ncbi:hypothetical protein DUNSADRAFT_568 [Dunaliella salina]|uniref:Uncharacterized protein n=1 Tax=Dunaliella salina TaxID=3046 RepID=A0ABQ7FYR3_DUNSA|nr:hypothetical protein DUNSADRAFT_568 [Dunaliella salina]|eukprot:KAF5827485.1 hypothetical protein DUNSADRAFT_568 [Dunaliella salina]
MMEEELQDLPKQPSAKPESKAKQAIAKALRSVEFFSKQKAKPKKDEELRPPVQKPSPRPSTEVPGAQIDESVLDTIDDVEAQLSEVQTLSREAKSFSVPRAKPNWAGFLVSPALSSFTNEERSERTKSESAARESWHAQRKLLLQQLQEQQQQQQGGAPWQHRHEKKKIRRRASQTQLLPSIDSPSTASPAASFTQRGPPPAASYTQRAAPTPHGRIQAALAQQRPGTSTLQLRNDTTLSPRSSSSFQHQGSLPPKTKGDTLASRPSHLQFSAEEPSILGPVSRESPSPPTSGSLPASLTSLRTSANAPSAAVTTALAHAATPPLPFSRSSLPSLFGTSTGTSSFSTQLAASQALQPSTPTSLSAPNSCVLPLRPKPPVTDKPQSPRPGRSSAEGLNNPAGAISEGLQTPRDKGPAPAPPAIRARFTFATQASINRSEGPISKSNSQKRTLGRAGSSMKERSLVKTGSSKKERSLSRSGSSKKERMLTKCGSSKKERGLSRSGSSKNERALSRSGNSRKESQSRLLSKSGSSKTERSLARSGSSKKRPGIKLHGTNVRRDTSSRSLLSGKSGSGRRRASVFDSSEPERSAPSEPASQKSQWFSLSRGSSQLTESLDTADSSVSDSSANDESADLLSSHMFPEPELTSPAGLPPSQPTFPPPRKIASAKLLHQAVGKCAATAASSSGGSEGGDAPEKAPGLINRKSTSQLASLKGPPRKQCSTPNMKQARFNLPAMPPVNASPPGGSSFHSPRPPEVPPPPSVAVRPVTTACTTRTSATPTSSLRTPSSLSAFETKPGPTRMPGAQAERPPSQSGKLAKEAGSLKQFLAGQRLDVNRLEPDTYLLMLDVESKGRAHTVGRFAGQSRPRSKSSSGPALARSLTRASMPSPAADGPDEDSEKDSDVADDVGGEYEGGRAGSVPAQGKAGSSLSSMLAQFKDEEKELQMLHERARSSLASRSRERSRVG